MANKVASDQFITNFQLDRNYRYSSLSLASLPGRCKRKFALDCNCAFCRAAAIGGPICFPFRLFFDSPKREALRRSSPLLSSPRTPRFCRAPSNDSPSRTGDKYQPKKKPVAEKESTLDPPKSRLHSASPVVTGFHHRRRSSTSVSPLRLVKDESSEASRAKGSTSGLVAGSLAHPTSTLAPIPGTPADPVASPMSLSRSPSPLPGGGWSSPGLNAGSGSSSPRFAPRSPGLQPESPSWAAARAKSDQVRSYPSFSTRNTGFFSRQKRKISASLPRFALSHDYSEQEKLNRGRTWPKGDGSLKGRLLALTAHMATKRRVKLLSLGTIALTLYLCFWSCMVFHPLLYPCY